jgi:DNA-binding transcriptional LysR family regulator
MDRLASLEVFVGVVDQGGFSAAARRLNMSVSMVSNHVQALEDRLGARLLNRTTRKVGLTEIGKSYYERCVQILGELADADRIAEALQSSPRGTLKLYVASHIMRFIAPVVSEYLSLYPEAAIELTTGERMVDLVEEGYDLAIWTFLPPDSAQIIRHLSPWRHMLCCAPSYLERHGAPKDVAELGRHNCLRYVYYPYGDDWRFIRPDGQTVSVRVSGNLLTTNGEALRRAALDGHGIFMAPGFIAGEDLAAGRLVRVLEDHTTVEFSISAIYPHRHNLSSKVRCFIDLLAERFVEHRKWLNPKPGAISAPPAG